MSNQGTLNENLPMRKFTLLMFNLNCVRHISNFIKPIWKTISPESGFLSTWTDLREIGTISYFICILRFYILLTLIRKGEKLHSGSQALHIAAFYVCMHIKGRAKELYLIP